MSHTAGLTQRSRVLTGCFTCRDRRVKCDETRPICFRCQQLNLPCQGYQVKIVWLHLGVRDYEPADIQAGEQQASGRKCGRPNKEKPASPMTASARRPLYTEDERSAMAREVQSAFLPGDQMRNISKALGELDAEEGRPHGVDKAVGPFGVFAFAEADDSIECAEDYPAAGDADEEGYEPIEQGGYTSLADIGHALGAPMGVPSFLGSRLVPENADLLLDYYRSDVVDYMCHLPNPASPWNRIYLPRALQTMSNLMLFGHASRASMALFYALLSVSSNHVGSRMDRSDSLAGVGGGSIEPDAASRENAWLQKGSAFQTKAAAYIGACLHQRRRRTTADTEDLVMSLLSMITISVTSGNMNSARNYLQQAGIVIQECSSAATGLQTGITSVLGQIHSYLWTIFGSTDVLLDDRRSLQHVGSLVGSSNEEESSFWRIYGLPKSLIALIARTDDLARAGHALGTGRRDRCCHPALFEASCQQLEDQICGWDPALLDGGGCSGGHDAPGHHDGVADARITTFLAQAVYNALVVTFFRRVRRVNRMLLQHYIDKTADYLNGQEAIKSARGIRTPALVWPWFMAASEAKAAGDTRAKLLQWAHSARRYGGRNLQAAEDVVRETWRRMDAHLPDDVWVDVVRERQVTLILT